MKRKDKAAASKTGNLRAIFAIPLVLAVVTAIGLVSALLGDGIWNALSWLALGLPVVVVARYWRGTQDKAG